MSDGYRLIERGRRPFYYEDLHCARCGRIERDVYYRAGEWPVCCRERMAIAILSPRLTDCYGTPRYSDASGKFHGSRRELVEHMKSKGFEECGDPVGGARVSLELRNSAFSYAGQVSRASTEERKRERKRLRALSHSGRLQSADAVR